MEAKDYILIDLIGKADSIFMCLYIKENTLEKAKNK